MEVWGSQELFHKFPEGCLPSSVLQLQQLVHVAVRESRQFHSAITTLTRRLIGTVQVVLFLHARPEVVVVVVFERVACWTGAFFGPSAAASGTCSSYANV